MRDPLSKKIQQIEPSGIRKFFDIVSEMKDAISLGVGEPDFDTPWHIREEGIYSLERGRTYYTSNAGLQELKDEVALYQERRFGLHYDRINEVMITVGGSEAIDGALRTMLDPGDEVLLPHALFNFSIVPYLSSSHFIKRLRAYSEYDNIPEPTSLQSPNANNAGWSRKCSIIF